MPATQVKLDDGNEAINRIFHVGDGEKHLRMAHETIVMLAQLRKVLSLAFSMEPSSFLLGDPLQHAPRLENKGREDNATQVGAGPQLRDDVSEDWAEVSI